MLKIATISVGVLALSGPVALAQVVLPGGLDVRALEVPIDVTPQQLYAQRPYLYALRSGRSVAVDSNRRPTRRYDRSQR